MDERRSKRVAEALREELSELIGYELSDPRVAGVRVADVHVSPDLRHARILVISAAGEDRAGALQALDGARHFLRRHLAARLDLLRIPELHFEAGPAAAGQRLESLLRRVRRGRPRDEAGEDEKKASG